MCDYMTFNVGAIASTCSHGVFIFLMCVYDLCLNVCVECVLKCPLICFWMIYNVCSNRFSCGFICVHVFTRCAQRASKVCLQLLFKWLR